MVKARALMIRVLTPCVVVALMLCASVSYGDPPVIPTFGVVAATVATDTTAIVAPWMLQAIYLGLGTLAITLGWKYLRRFFR